MQKPIYREKAMDRLSSPEKLNDYLRVTNPSVWLALIAIIVLLAAGMIWVAVTGVESSVSGTAVVQGGEVRMTFENNAFAEKVQEGMLIRIGHDHCEITSIGEAEDGSLFATAKTSLGDGSYNARVTYKETQLLSLLFN